MRRTSRRRRATRVRLDGTRRSDRFADATVSEPEALRAAMRRPRDVRVRTNVSYRWPTPHGAPAPRQCDAPFRDDAKTGPCRPNAAFLARGRARPRARSRPYPGPRLHRSLDLWGPQRSAEGHASSPHG